MNTLEQTIQQNFTDIPETAQWGACLQDVTSGSQLAETGTEDVVMNAVSLNKLAIAHAIELQQIRSDETVRIEHDDRRGGDGVLVGLPLGYELKLGAVLHQMLSRSDNTAARICVRRLGGPDKLHDTLADSKLDVPNTALVLDTGESGSDPEAHFLYGKTTPREAASLFRSALHSPLYARALQHGHHSEGLRNTFDNPRIPQARAQDFAASALYDLHKRGGKAPQKVYDWLLSEQAPQTYYGNKIGNFDGARHDVAHIGSRIIAVLYQDTGDQRTKTTERVALPAQRAIGKAAYAAWLQEISWT